VTDFVLDNTGSINDTASVSLKSVAGISFRGSTESSVQLSGKLIRYKRLQQHDRFWAKLRADPDVKATVPYWTSRYRPPVCLVVGIMICEDVDLSFNETHAQEREANGQLPLGTIIVAAGVPNIIGNATDPQVGFNSNRQIVTMFRGKVSESRIFALELKKITTQGWIQKELRLRTEGPDVADPTRVAAAESDESDEDDEQLGIDDFILGGLEAGGYSDIME
jgi:hypothetical protein